VTDEGPFRADRFNRTALLSVLDNTASTVEEALDRHARTGVVIAADDVACASYLGQAALLSAVRTAVRAFGSVWVCVPEVLPDVLGGPDVGMSLREALVTQGAALHLPTDRVQVGERRPVILIGAATVSPPVAPSAKVELRATWSGWTATVAPARQPTPNCDEVCVLAAIAAGALAVSEAFGLVEDRPGSDAGYRTVSLDLFAPLGGQGQAPQLAWAPSSWWLVGLGHLGQAFAWTIAWLPYESALQAEVVLQDTDATTKSNYFTGVMTPEGSEAVPKTRLVAACLEAAGLQTRILERKLGPDLRRELEEAHVAILGIDKVAARRLTTGVGWKLAIDVGLGRGAQGYAGIHLVRFPGSRASSDVPAWQDGGEGLGSDQVLSGSPALRELHERDECGAVTLAGTAAGASFVGVVAGCLAIAEACRPLNGGVPCDVLDVDLRAQSVRGGVSDHEVLPAPLRLR